MNEEIEKAAIAFVEDEGCESDYEKEQRVYDFVNGAKYVLRKIFDAYLDERLNFTIWDIENR